MTARQDALGALQRLAQLKSDLEMRKFSAYRAHVTAARARIDDLGHELQDIYARDQAFSIAEARLANALAGDTSRALSRAERDLDQMLPGFEQARMRAQREFGRVQALRALHDEFKNARKDGG